MAFDFASAFRIFPAKLGCETDAVLQYDLVAAPSVDVKLNPGEL